MSIFISLCQSKLYCKFSVRICNSHKMKYLANAISLINKIVQGAVFGAARFGNVIIVTLLCYSQKNVFSMHFHSNFAP